MKHVYEVYIHNAAEKRNYNFGKVWTSYEAAKRYMDETNNYYIKCSLPKVAYIQTLNVIE